MRTLVPVAAILFVLASALPAASALGLAVVTDTGTDATTKSIIAGALSAGAQGAIGLGDYGHDDPISVSLAVLDPLFSKAAYLVLGNHDSRSELTAAGLLPEGGTWSRALGGVRVVGGDTTQQIARGTTEYGQIHDMLCGATEPTKVLALHKPWWLLSGARHPGWEFPGSPSDMDALVRECGVDVVLAGHEHNYQRLARGDAWYVIVGPAGDVVRSVLGSPSGTVASCACSGRLMLDLSTGSLAARFVDAGGRERDRFTANAATSGGSTPAISFSRSTGNEWWVQVVVSGTDAWRVARVDAMDTGGSWTPITLRSWGAWAGSLHVEAGHLVQYRATLSDGRAATSCLFTHPAGVCTSGGTTGGGSFDASFLNVRGNAWWVETDVRVTGGSLVGVDARVDGGAWTPLEHKSWGSWARSIAAPSGSVVEFRARAGDGQTDTSSRYGWPP